MFLFRPNIKKMHEKHDIPGLLKIIALPGRREKVTKLRIEALNALKGFCHRRVLEDLIDIMADETEVPTVRSNAQSVFKSLVFTLGAFTYEETIDWWNNNKGRHDLIEKNRLITRDQELTRIDNETRRIFRPSKNIEALIYRQSREPIEFAEVAEWHQRTQPLIYDRIKAERNRLEEIWRKEDLLWEQDEERLNQTGKAEKTVGQQIS